MWRSGVSHLGVPLRGPNHKDYRIWGSILALLVGKLSFALGFLACQRMPYDLSGPWPTRLKGLQSLDCHCSHVLRLHASIWDTGFWGAFRGAHALGTKKLVQGYSPL